MRALIGQVREAMPFEAPEARICEGSCQGCAMKLLEFLESELMDWEHRLNQGEKPGLADLSRVARVSRKVYRVMRRKGLVETAQEEPS